MSTCRARLVPRLDSRRRWPRRRPGELRSTDGHPGLSMAPSDVSLRYGQTDGFSGCPSSWKERSMRQVGAFCVGLLWIVVCGVGTVSAQSFSLPKITDMNGFLEIGQFNGSDPWARDRRVMTGWGFEISFDASGSPPKPADCTPQMCPEPSKYCTLEDKVRAKIEKDEGAAKEQEESEVIKKATPTERATALRSFSRLPPAEPQSQHREQLRTESGAQDSAIRRSLRNLRWRLV